MQKLELNKNEQLKKRVNKDIISVPISTLLRVIGSITHLDLDYCGEWTTEKKVDMDIKDQFILALNRNVVVINGTITLTVKNKSRKVKGQNVKREIAELLEKYPNY
ncbi:MAG: hypothetical protein AABY22_36905, partial [Nanoarchaeota archaeon]